MRCSRPSVPTRTCSSTIAASAGVWRRCWAATGDDLSLPERNCARTPMQWSTEPHGGFTKDNRPSLPVIEKGPYGYEHVNAAAQRRDANSMLNWTERIIRMRKEVPEIGWGDYKIIT